MFSIHQDHVIPRYSTKDVHSKSKGVASLRSPEAASLPQLLQLTQRLIPGDLESFRPSIEQMLETVQQGEMEVELQVALLHLFEDLFVPGEPLVYDAYDSHLMIMMLGCLFL